MLVTFEYRRASALPELYELQLDAPARIEADVELARRIVGAFLSAAERRGLEVPQGNYEPLVAKATSWVSQMGRPALERGQANTPIEFVALDEPQHGGARVAPRPRPSGPRAPTPAGDLWGDDGG